VDLGVDPTAIILDKLISVAGVPVHVVITVRGAAIGEEDSDLVGGLWVLCKVVL